MTRGLLLLCLLFAQAVRTQDSIPKRAYRTTFVNDTLAPKIDGSLKDKAWEQVPWSGNYVEWSPNENTEPTEQTKLKILYDKKNIYVAFRCYDAEPSAIVRRLSRRDGFDGDWVEINIGSLGDERTAYSFTISVTGVKGEEFITNNGANWDTTWNPIWYVKTKIDAEGWTAEVRIPLSQLRFGKTADQVWGIQSTRRYFRKEERSVWQRSPQNAAGWVSSFGELHGLEHLRPQRQLELQPYVVSAVNTYEAEAGNPFRDGNDSRTEVGFDGKMGITNDLTLDVTINPDFGQVEADPSAIALDGFQIFFQEQRPFFIENKNIFDYPFSNSFSGNTFGFNNLFYSRRIGRAPQGFPSLEANENTDVPDVSTILGAAKFSGKTRDGWSLGLLESVTAKEVALISGPSGDREETVEPLTNYVVGRVQKDFNENNTFIGGMLTAVNRDLPENLQFLHKAAYTGGVDLTHQWQNRKWYLKGNFIFSQVNGSPEAITATQRSITRLFQRKGASYLDVDNSRTSLTGTGGNIQIGKASGNWRFETGVLWHSPELELNDIGFQLRADDYRHYAWGQFRTTKPRKSVRAFVINYVQATAFDFGGNLNTFTAGTNGWVNLNNNWFINGGITYQPIRISNVALRGGPRIRLPETFAHRIGFNSDSRKKIRLNASYSASYSADNAIRTLGLNGQLTYQPTNALQLSLLPSYSENDDRLQYVTTVSFNGTSQYVNATIAQRTLSLPLRIDYILSPNLSLQYWGQPFISRGRYRDFKYVTDPLAGRFSDRFKMYSSEQLQMTAEGYALDQNRDGITDFRFARPDFAFVQWRSNLVLRWEYIPGSELYLVWSQDASRFGSVEQGLVDGLKDTLDRPQNIFLFKATYRFVR